MHAGFVGIFIPEYLLSALTENPDGKPLSGGTSVQNIPRGPAYPASSARYITLAFHLPFIDFSHAYKNNLQLQRDFIE